MDDTRSESELHLAAATVSRDGYIRVASRGLDDITLVHLSSDPDSDFLDELRRRTVPAVAAGFSEWISSSVPVVSLGWGWFVHSHSGRLLLAPDGVRSNLMLTDTRGYDIGLPATSQMLSDWLVTYPWHQSVASALRYLPQLSALPVT